ncbi:MAG: sigma-54 dependent transcriptional regulator [Myxococcota bacterium]
MERPRILIVDDDTAMREMLASLFQEQSYETIEASSANAALDLAKDAEFDVVLSDIKMPGKSGIALVGELRQLRPQTPVVLMTAFGSVQSAVDAMRAGALDYLTKPFEPEQVLLRIERALERRRLEEENQQLRSSVERTANFGDLIGESPAMREVFAMIRKVAAGRSSVLITGESGTGKEVVARTLHYHGSRQERPFLPINCTAIPEGLLESELFGHVRGAFTGATSTKRGLFEKANGGTLFLDEIGDMGAGPQSKLLRVLQDQEIRPVGGTQAVQVDVRIVAATNQDLSEAIEEGRFREDLFYRLNVIPIHIPPLRERPEDIPALVKAFVARHGDGTRSFSADSIRRLQQEAWRGNARELENFVERSLALSDASVLQVTDLPALDGLDHTDTDAEETELVLREAARRGITLRELEDRYIDQVLLHTGGRKGEAAQRLGIDRKTLYRRQPQRPN